MSACKLSFRDVEEIKRLRASGETYASIAVRFAVSPTLVRRYCDADKPYHRAFENDKIVYTGIREWLAEHKISLLKMCREVDASYYNMYHIVTGKGLPRKDNIDKILKYTGMTYEEAFSRD